MSGQSNITLRIRFTATADTERMRATEIARRVGLYLSVELDAANVVVEVDGAALDYREAHERERDEQSGAQWGNPKTDGLN